MNTRISFIISRPLKPVIQGVISDLKQECSGNIYIAEEPHQAYQLYRQHLTDTDIFIFSGKMFLYTVGSQESVYQKPCFSLDGITTNINDILLDLFLKNDTIDLRRIFIDVSYNDYNYLGLKELLPADKQPYFLDMNVPELEFVRESGSGSDMLENFNEYVYQTHLRLHNEGKIDLSITRFGTLAAHFKQQNIPFRYIHPTSEYVTYFVRQCLNDYHRKHLFTNTMSAFVIRFSSSPRPDTDQLITMIDQTFSEYTGSALPDYQVSQTDHSIELIMPATALFEMTDHLRDMRMAETLLAPFSDAFDCCGFGCGKTVMEALFNAYTAAEAGRGPAKQIFCITKDGKITGPLGENPVTIEEEPDTRLCELAERLDINHRTLQKIITFTKISNTKAVTSKDISRYLRITRKSGNRILNKIVKKGGAVIYKDNMNAGKGRPKNYYELTFLDEMK